MTIFIGGSPHLLGIGGMSEVGHHRPVRAAKGYDARIAPEVQAVALWQCNGVVVAHGSLVPSARSLHFV